MNTSSTSAHAVATGDLTDSASALREGVERALREYLTVDFWHQRESAGDDDAFDTELWQLINELAIPALLLDEAAGGAQASLLEASGALETLGALAVPAPAAEAMVAHWCAAQAGFDLGTSGAPVTLAPAMPQDAINLTRTAGGMHVQAELANIPFARHCETVVLQAALDDTLFTCMLPIGASGMRITPAAGLNGEARDNISVDMTLSSQQISDSAGVNLLQAGAAMRCVQMASALNAALNMCVSYVTERNQFGRPLAKFQAIQQQLAIMTALATNAQVGARQAFASLNAPLSKTAVAAAKTATGQAASQGAAIAHQVHGAMGFTAEYGLHRLTRRLWTWREEFGNEAWWSRQLGQMALQAGADGLWDMLINEPAA